MRRQDGWFYSGKKRRGKLLIMLQDNIMVIKTWNDHPWGFVQKILEKLDAWELLQCRAPRIERFFLITEYYRFIWDFFAKFNVVPWWVKQLFEQLWSEVLILSLVKYFESVNLKSKPMFLGAVLLRHDRCVT